MRTNTKVVVTSVDESDITAGLAVGDEGYIVKGQYVDLLSGRWHLCHFPDVERFEGHMGGGRVKLPNDRKYWFVKIED